MVSWNSAPPSRKANWEGEALRRRCLWVERALRARSSSARRRTVVLHARSTSLCCQLG